MRKSFYSILVLIVVSVFLIGCGTPESSDSTKTKDSSDSTEDSESSGLASGSLSTKPIVEIEVADYGTITVELEPDVAPITVENFLKLVNDGFYDGLTFHRIMSGFMIQGGDPKGNGSGGADETIKGEFSDNGVENNLSHTRGAISMARSNANDSASSQFFIVHEKSNFLDGKYAAFGYVTDGMDIVDQICKDTPVQDEDGTVNAGDQPVITSIKVVE